MASIKVTCPVCGDFVEDDHSHTISARQIAVAQASIDQLKIEKGKLIADMMGCRDGALVRDLQVEVDRLAQALRKRDERYESLRETDKKTINGFISQLATAEQKIKELLEEHCMCGLDPMATIHQLRAEDDMYYWIDRAVFPTWCQRIIDWFKGAK